MSSLNNIARFIDGIKSQGEAAAGGPARLAVGLLLGCAYGLDGADKAAVSAVAESLEKEFHIGNVDIGLLLAGVSFVGAVFTLPVGLLADRVNRRRILLVSIAIWTVAMVVSGTAMSFIYLLVVRLFLGAVTATAAPTVASLVGDFIPPQARSSIYGIILSSELVGTGLGFFLAGEVSSYLNWRWAFYLMALPSIAAFFILWRFLPEPGRGGQSWIQVGQSELSRDISEDESRNEHGASEDAGEPSGETGNDTSARPRHIIQRAGIRPRQELVLHEDPTDWSLWRALRYMLRIPTYSLLIIASSLGYYFFAGTRAFGMIYLTHHYGLPRTTVTALAAIIGIGALFGFFVGARLSERLLNRGYVSARVVIPGVALLLAIVLIGPAIWIGNAYVGTALLATGTAALAGANPPIDAARLDIVPSRLWGRGEAGRMALRGLLEGGAPLLFGAMSEWLGGGTNGIEWTFLIMLVPVVVASSLAIPARRTYPRDVATADASMRRLQWHG
jgi:predicted MFS family arabinose efflux permease